jgi:hypothetical protein
MSKIAINNGVANAGNAPSIAQGADASKPTAAPYGALYFADDTNIIYWYNGSAWQVLVNGGNTGQYINNSNLLQNPGTFNIAGSGQIQGGSTDPAVSVVAAYLTNLIKWQTVTAQPGTLYAAVEGINTQQFSEATYVLLNSVTIAASFYRLIMTATVNTAVTLNQNGSLKRAIAAQVLNVYLPALVSITATVTDLAGLLIQSVYQDAGTTNSFTATNYYALLIQQVDEQLRYAAITNKYAIWQDGTADIVNLRGLLRFSNANITASAGAANYFLQPDAAGNITSVAAYTSGALATYTGTIVWQGITPPSGTTTHTYRWQQTGNQVTVNITLLYSIAGAGLTFASFTVPSGLPSPVYPTGYTNLTTMATGTALVFTAIGTTAASAVLGQLRLNGTNWQFTIGFSSLAVISINATFTYFTS